MLQGAFQHRSGRVVALARMLFACVSMVAISLDPSQPARYPTATYAVLWVYVVLSAAYLLSTWNNWWLEQRLALAGHALDVCLFGAMVFLTAGYTSPFFTFFVYILLSATIRWGWKQTAVASSAVIALFVAAGLLSSDLNAASLEVSRIIMRATYLIMLSLLLIWFGYNLEAMYSWGGPQPASDAENTNQLSIRSGLEAAMARVGARQAALVWSEEEEPWVNLAVLRDRELRQQRHPPDSFGHLVAQELQGKVFIFDSRNGRALARTENGTLQEAKPTHPVDPELATAIGVQEGLAVPVGAGSDDGLLLLSGIDGLCADDLKAGQFAGEALSALLERSAVIVASEEAAAARTRLALARDLHDSIVQLLAGTSMRLQGIKQAIASGKEVIGDLDTLQRDLSEQQRDLRLIIGQLRDVPTQGAPAKLKLILRDALDGAARQWGVRGTMGRCPEGNDVAVGLQGQLRHLLNESVANAVKHGKAATVKLSAELEDGALVMILEDDGAGISLPDQNGQTKPWSLYERVQALGGTLSLHSYGHGSQLRFLRALESRNMTRVLIADDHPFILAGLTAILHNSEFEVITSVTNGAEALAALPRWKPDILVVDVAMPVRTGMDVLRELRKRDDPLKIVLLTASLDSQQVAEAIELQADGVVLKEGAQHLLLECLRSVKDGRQWLQPELAQKVALQAQRKDPLTGLAPRERAIVRLLETGKRNREIAEDLGTTEGTVKVYLHRIYEKLGVGNRTELALLAKQER